MDKHLKALEKLMPMTYIKQCERLETEFAWLQAQFSELKRQHERLQEALRFEIDGGEFDCCPTLKARLRSALDSTSSELSKQGPELSWLDLENENLKKNLAALEKHLEKTK